MRYVLLISLLTGCTTVRPYQRENVVRRVMDAEPIPLETSFASFEKLSQDGSGSVAVNCPTCGG